MFDAKQLSIEEFVKSQAKYDKHSGKYNPLLKKLAIFNGTSNVSNSLVEYSEFSSLLKTAALRIIVIGRSTIRQEIDLVVADVTAIIKVLLAHANKIHFCTDLWSK